MPQAGKLGRLWFAALLLLFSANASAQTFIQASETVAQFAQPLGSHVYCISQSDGAAESLSQGGASGKALKNKSKAKLLAAIKKEIAKLKSAPQPNKLKIKAKKRTKAGINKCGQELLSPAKLVLIASSLNASSPITTPQIGAIDLLSFIEPPTPPDAEGTFSFAITAAEGSQFFPAFNPATPLNASTTLLISYDGNNWLPLPTAFFSSSKLLIQSKLLVHPNSFQISLALVTLINQQLLVSDIVSATVFPAQQSPQGGDPSPVPSLSPSPSPSVSPSPTATSSPTPTGTPTPTATATPTPTATPDNGGFVSYPAPIRVNCGDLNGYPTNEPGYSLLSQSASPSGITLAPAALDTVHIAQLYPTLGVIFPSIVNTVDADLLSSSHRFTSLQLADNTVLTVANLSPNSNYRVLLELGALGMWWEFENGAWVPRSTASRQIVVETKIGGVWKKVAQDINARTGYLGSSFKTDIGGIIPHWMVTRSDSSGKIYVRLSTTGADPLFLSGFEVHAKEDLPVFYKRTAQGPLQSSSPTLSAFVNAFNANNFAQAETSALELGNPYERAAALMHLIGWLDGSRDGHDYLIASAHAAIDQALNLGHIGAYFLRGQLSAYERALNHNAARGYSKQFACPDQGGKGYLNPECFNQVNIYNFKNRVNENSHIALRELSALIAPINGDTVLDDLVNWNAGSIPATQWEPSPLLPAALKQYGVTITLPNPLLATNSADPDSAEMMERLRDIFNDFVQLGFASTDFPVDLELRMFQSYANSELHPAYWDPTATDIFTDAEIATSWWGTEVAKFTPDPDAPTWANLQRDMSSIHTNAVRYWLAQRFDGQEFGGGSGDDIELLLQLFMILAGKQGPQDALLLDKLDSAIRYHLEESPDAQNGFYSGPITDAEHAGEYFTDPTIASLGLFGMTSRVAQASLDSTRHLLQPLTPASPFAGTSNLGRTHFKSFWYNADGPSTDPALAIDIFLNGRAMTPGILSGLMAPLSANHSMLSDLRSWANGWRDDALSTASSKPEGFPAPAQWPSNTLGTGGFWYSASSSASDTSLFSSGEVSYILELLRMSYRTSTASDRWRYLLPVTRMFRAVQKWEDAGSPSASAGTQWWAASQFKGGARFGPLVIEYLDELEDDSALATIPDPANPGSTYVDNVLISRLHKWAEVDYGLDKLSATRYALQPLLPCAPHSSKNPNSIQGPMKENISFLRNFYPLVTKHAMRTDRVFMSDGRGPHEVLASYTGAQITEGIAITPFVRWHGVDHNVSVLTNYRDYAGTDWSGFVYNFSTAPLTLGLTLERGLLPGTYAVDSGPVPGECDTFSGTPASSITIEKRGAAVSTNITLNPGINLVRISPIGTAPPAQSYDFVLDPPQLELSSSTNSLKARVRIANFGSAASPTATLTVTASAVDPQGNALSYPAQTTVLSTTVQLTATTSWTLSSTIKEILLTLRTLARHASGW